MLEHNLSDYSANRKFSTSYFVCKVWDSVVQDLEEMDVLHDFTTCFDSTHTVITTTLELLMVTHTTIVYKAGMHM